MSEPIISGMQPQVGDSGMKTVPERPTMSQEDYEKRLSLVLADISSQDLRTTGQFTFSVTPEPKIFITNKNHAFLADNFGVELDHTWVEGYLKLVAGKAPEIWYKQPYQPVKSFPGTGDEELNLKNAVSKMILETIKEVNI